MEYNTIVSAILAGQLDNDLDRLTSAVRERRAAVARATYYTLSPGDKVQFVATAHPQYLAGAKGVVREIRRTKVVIDLDTPVGRFSRGIVTPVTIIKKLA